MGGDPWRRRWKQIAKGRGNVPPRHFHVKANSCSSGCLERGRRIGDKTSMLGQVGQRLSNEAPHDDSSSYNSRYLRSAYAHDRQRQRLESKFCKIQEVLKGTRRGGQGLDSTAL